MLRSFMHGRCAQPGWCEYGFACAPVGLGCWGGGRWALGLGSRRCGLRLARILNDGMGRVWWGKGPGSSGHACVIAAQLAAGTSSSASRVPVVG